MNRFTSNNRQMLADQIANIMDLKAVKLSYYKGKNLCSINNGGCNHLCLNRPNNNYTCDCQIGKVEISLLYLPISYPYSFN